MGKETQWTCPLTVMPLLQILTKMKMLLELRSINIFQEMLLAKDPL